MNTTYLTEEKANQVWEILVKNCKVYNSEGNKNSFINCAIHHGITEYRFQGNLGFGGKLWGNRSPLVVSCYREDETSERLQVIKNTNEELSKLQTEVSFYQ